MGCGASTKAAAQVTAAQPGAGKPDDFPVPEAVKKDPPAEASASKSSSAGRIGAPEVCTGAPEVTGSTAPETTPVAKEPTGSAATVPVTAVTAEPPSAPETTPVAKEPTVGAESVPVTAEPPSAIPETTPVAIDPAPGVSESPVAAATPAAAPEISVDSASVAAPVVVSEDDAGEVAAIKEAHPDWVELFESLGPDEGGLLSFQSAASALRSVTGVTRVQVDALLRAMDLNKDGRLSLTEYVLMGNAILTADFSRYASLCADDFKAFQEVYTDANAVREKVRKGLRDALMQPEMLRALGDKYDRIQELRQQHSDLAELFDAHDPECSGHVTSQQVSQAIRQKAPTASKAQLAMLCLSTNKDQAVNFYDFEFFYYALQALTFGVLDYFPEINAQEFKDSQQEFAALHSKVKANMMEDSGATSKRPEWFAKWENLAKDEETLPVENVATLVLEIADGQVSKAQVQRLVNAFSLERLTFVHCTHVLNASLHGDFSEFPELSVAEFNAISEDQRERFLQK